MEEKKSVSTLDTSKVETKVKQSLKGITIEKAIDLLDNVKSDLISQAPMDKGLRKII